MTAEEVRERVATRAHYCCEYCFSQQRLSHDDFAVEHIAPRSAGGTSELANLAFSCQGCNNRKYTATQAVDPVSGDTAPLYHPRRDDWSAHFAWSDDGSEIIGLSPTGRATVARLALNRPFLVNLRRALSVSGLHPPLPPYP